MDNEKGVVTAIENGEVTVEFYRSSACEKCGACMMAKDTGRMFLLLPYNKEINVGDEVYVDVEKKFFLLSSALLYIVPLIVLIATVAIGINVLEGDSAQIYSALAGIVLSFASYFIMRIFKRKFASMKQKSMTYYKV